MALVRNCDSCGKIWDEVTPWYQVRYLTGERLNLNSLPEWERPKYNPEDPPFMLKDWEFCTRECLMTAFVLSGVYERRHEFEHLP
jgi:hypothetical protein